MEIDLSQGQVLLKPEDLKTQETRDDLKAVGVFFQMEILEVSQ